MANKQNVNKQDVNKNVKNIINPAIFREYDIRGIVNTDLNEHSVKLLGYFFGQEAKRRFQQKYGDKKSPTITVGYDARLHSKQLRDFLVAGLNASGCTVFDIGMVPTPVSYFSGYQKIKDMQIKQENDLLQQVDTQQPPFATIMITGSHNPKEFNGFKITLEQKPFFGQEIYKLRDEIIKHQNFDTDKFTNTKAYSIDAKRVYIDFMVKHFDYLKGMPLKIVADGGNGVAGTVICDIFDKLNLNVQCLYMDPDGNFPNHHPDPAVEENLQDVKKALKHADIAFAYDGDADRIAVLTHKYNITGDQLAILFAKLMKNPTVIGEVKCSSVMYDELQKMGATPVMYKTGHSNIEVKIKEINADLACEVSGHVYFYDKYYGFDDAIYATFRVLDLLYKGMDLDAELDKLPKLYTTPVIKLDTTDEEKFQIIDKVREYLDSVKDAWGIQNIIDIDGLRIEFKHGWALVRASNTTPKLILRFEAINQELAEDYKQKILELVQQVMNS